MHRFQFFSFLEKSILNRNFQGQHYCFQTIAGNSVKEQQKSIHPTARASQLSPERNKIKNRQYQNKTDSKQVLCYQDLSIKVRMSWGTPILDKCASASQEQRRSRNANMAYLDARIPSVGYEHSAKRRQTHNQPASVGKQNQLVFVCFIQIFSTTNKQNKTMPVHFCDKKVTNFVVFVSIQKFYFY